VHPLGSIQQRKPGDGNNGQCHAIQDVDLQQIGGGTVRVSEQEQLDAERECKEAQVPGPAQRRHQTILAACRLALHAMHHERECYASQKQEDGRSNAADEL
jgi:hypothetical protein